MSDYRVASRYAKSVFDLAIELKTVDKIYGDMLLIREVCSQNRKLVILLKNPIIRYDFKLRVLTKIFQKHVDLLTIKFFGMICRKNRASILPDASSIFTSLYDEYVGIVRANVSSAVDLSAQVRKEFESILAKETGKKIALDSKVDQSLLGGYILRVGDLQIDDSLKTKINNLRRELKHRP